jgi:hypothetical protein
VPKARLYHSNRKQDFTFELEEGKVVIQGFVNEINNKFVSCRRHIKGESTSVKVLPWDPFATFNVAVLIHSFVHIGCAFGMTILFLFVYQPSCEQSEHG